MANLKGKIIGAVTGFTLLTGMLFSFEGTILTGYADPIGVATACTGHTGPDVVIGKEYTADECRGLLRADGRVAWDAVTQLVTIPLMPYQHAAFASFVFNEGIGAFKGSTMLKLINAGRVQDACNELPRWNLAGGRVWRGLVIRREKERQVCLGNDRTIQEFGGAQ